MVGRTAAQGRIPALKRTVFTSHGENARRNISARRSDAGRSGQSDGMKLSISWNGDGWANAAQSALRPLKRTVFISHGENARQSGEPGVSRLSPVRCRQKERRIPRGVSIFSKMYGKMYRLDGG